MTDQKTHLFTFLIIIFCLVYTNPTFSEISSARDIRISSMTTTRLISTAETGVGAVLLEESLILNPASIAFFGQSTLYYQSSKHKPDEDSTEPGSKSFSIIASDTNSSLKGAFGYYKFKQNREESTQFLGSVAGAISEKSSIGINFKHTKDFLSTKRIFKEKKYTSFNFGITHILSPELNIGLVIQDPTKSTPENDLVLFGIQYVFQDTISLMVDIGSTYRENLRDNYLYRFALQVKFLNDFYIRSGLSRDLSIDRKNTGIGLSWVQPKLSVDIAFRNVEDVDLSDTFVESAFSVAYRF